MSACRVIIDGPHQGSWNMAVDEALLRSQATAPILRLYRWQPATLSLGYFQPVALRESHPPSIGCPTVRRSSGGGAIVHDAEITYSLIMPQLARDRAAEELYDCVHNAVVEWLRSWGMEARIWTQSAQDTSRFLCFQRRSTGDIIAGDDKVMGSAQRRHHQAVLQHGSLLLSRSQFAPELPGVEEIAGVQVEISELPRRLARSITGALGCSAAESQLSDRERREAADIEKSRYASNAWLHKR